MVVLQASFGEWQPITVHLVGRISVRDRSSPYKGAMFAAYPGDVVFSKIDARSGAIGVLPNDIPKAVVTSEFPVFVADPEKLDGRFVRLVLRTGGFLKTIRAKATGTSGRKRITPEAFLNLRIPLPSTSWQTSKMDGARNVSTDRPILRNGGWSSWEPCRSASLMKTKTKLSRRT